MQAHALEVKGAYDAKKAKKQADKDRRQRDRDVARAALTGQGDRFVADLFF